MNSDAIIAHALEIADWGRSEEALGLLGRAVAANPRSGRTYRALGVVLTQMGRKEAAASALSRSLAVDPHSTTAKMALAKLAHELGLSEKRDELIGDLTARGPDHPDEALALGELLDALDRSSEALGLLTDAHSRWPEAAAVAVALGRREQQLARHTQARTRYEAALAADPAYAPAHASLGSWHEDTGKKDEALAAYERALALDPADNATLARHLALSGADATGAQIEQAAARLADEALPQDQRARIGFALGKVRTVRGEAEAAFRAVDMANRLQRRDRDAFDAASHARYVDGLIEMHPAVGPDEAADGARAARPIFIVGMPRSGTTLCEQILGMNPAVLPCGEQPFFTTLAKSGAVKDTAAALTAVAEQYLASLPTAPAPGQRPVDKMPLNTFHVGTIARVFPRARFVFCRRDPIDTCWSCFRENFNARSAFANDLGDLAAYWSSVDRLGRHWAALLGERFAVLPYEALTSDAEPVIRSLTGALDLPWDEAMLTPHRSGRAVNTPSRWQVRQPINARGVGAWRPFAPWLGPLTRAFPNSAS